MGLVKALLPVVLVAVLAGSAVADEIYRWVDEDGRVHFSNRSTDPPPAGADTPSASGEGWESMLERQEGIDEFSRRADAAANSLNVDLRRRKRERDRARDDLETIQREITRRQELRDAAGAYALRTEEAEAVSKLRQLENEVARTEAAIERVKAIKAMGREQAERQLGQNPFFQYGQ